MEEWLDLATGGGGWLVQLFKAQIQLTWLTNWGGQVG